MSVAVMPGLLVIVFAVRRYKTVKFAGKVGFEPGFIFDGPDDRCTADIEDVGNAGLYA